MIFANECAVSKLVQFRLLINYKYWKSVFTEVWFSVYRFLWHVGTAAASAQQCPPRTSTVKSLCSTALYLCLLLVLVLEWPLERLGLDTVLCGSGITASSMVGPSTRPHAYAEKPTRV